MNHEKRAEIISMELDPSQEEAGRRVGSMNGPAIRKSMPLFPASLSEIVNVADID